MICAGGHDAVSARRAELQSWWATHPSRTLVTPPAPAVIELVGISSTSVTAECALLCEALAPGSYVLLPLTTGCMLRPRASQPKMTVWQRKPVLSITLHRN